LVSRAKQRGRFAADRQNFDLKNTSETVVLESSYFSGYKGRLVIRLAGFGGRSFSLGILFIKPKLDVSNPLNINLIRHEYGHAMQLKQLGFFRYLKRIAIPSMSSKQTSKAYFEQPWEISADILGEVDPQVRSHSPALIDKGMDYLRKKRV